MILIVSCGSAQTTTPTASTPISTTTTTTQTIPTSTTPVTTTITTTMTPTTTTAVPTKTTTSTYLFPLIPHEPGEPPKIPHLYIAAYKTCDLCHIDKSTPISSIKIDESHSCNECHELRDLGEGVGPCQETVAVKYTCIFDFCHTYP